MTVFINKSNVPPNSNKQKERAGTNTRETRSVD